MIEYCGSISDLNEEDTMPTTIKCNIMHCLYTPLHVAPPGHLYYLASSWSDNNNLYWVRNGTAANW